MDDNDRAKIELRQNGPLVVKGLTSMVGEDGAELEAKPVMALCRCGQSRTKPFCDGSHKEAGFLYETV
ncbi:MAG: CDGSH iron-sulfur domain-containing protein, partial [Paracoccaceae bacterium]|nr:CDGSH iron-sulfur domain-containing protein [Paracoccaceae bacterium]